MTIKKKPASKATGSTAAGTASKTAIAAATAAPGGATSVSIGRKFTIPGKGQFESIQFSALVTAPTAEEASAMVEEIMVAEAEKAGAQFIALRESTEAMVADLEQSDEDEDDEGEEEADEDDAEADEDEADEDAEDEDEDGVDEEAVLAMDLKELKALVKDNDLDVDVTKHKTAKKLGPVVWAALAAAAEADDEDAEDEDEDAEDEDADEDGEEAEADEDEAEDEEDEEAAELDADEVLAMDRKGLLALAKDNDLEIDASAFTKNESGRKKLAAAILEALTGDEDEAEDEEADEDEDEAEDEGNKPYTRAELEKMKPADLEAIWDEWKIKGKKPTGSAPVVKKSYINKIMAAQDAE